jgi:hypothetical protein
LLLPRLDILVSEGVSLVLIGDGTPSDVHGEESVWPYEGEPVVEQLSGWEVLRCLGLDEEGRESHADGESVGGLGSLHLGELLLVQLALGE